MNPPAEKTIPSSRQEFWTRSRYAVIGDSSSKKKFPRLTYNGMKAMGKTVYPVDPGAGEIDGDRTYADLAGLPASVEAAVLELPREATAAWVEKAADAGIRELWLHDGTETPEALTLAARRGLRVETGACAVMYVTPGFSIHALHRWVMQLMKRY